MQAVPRFRLFSGSEDPDRVILVDGAEPGYRTLSHWPGNSTPGPLKRDLSTGIALAWARCAPAERQQLLGPFDTVANNHFDTDGVLSAFAVTNPEVALRHEALMLDAAATGDFCVWRGLDALRIDLTLLAFSSHPDSPALANLGASPSDRERWAAAYAFALAELPALLADPGRHVALIEREEREIVAQIERVEARRDVDVQRFPDDDLAVVRTRAPLRPVPLHHACGELYRVLVLHPGDDGVRARFCYRDESWFELVEPGRRPLPRVPLEPLRDRLAEAEGPRDDEAAWWCEGLQGPVPRLGFGRQGPGDGFFLDLDLADELPTRIEPEELVSLVRQTLREG